ncbi:putative protein FAM47C isoform X3 [Plectropomus leopardus]|uniref:putative protein FAM47C isoform X2 n=1 Tax=Plectropomus leopardus TaxID=160734 RepID=UPI001C4CAC44|nr:putative protein FAM47C isoform X2 [Plectropomus leopardus]XP_042371171.1 putative protein FAM47C isoform X3 [Plectropomus leopardus]
MSDFWPFSSSSPPPPRSHPQVPVYHLVPQTQVSLPYHLPEPQVTSLNPPEPQVTSLNPPEPQTKATSLDLVLKNQVTSPVLPEPQVTSPSFLLKSQETFAHLLPQTRVNSPHLIPESPVISSPLVPKNQETYMHLVPESQETSSNHSRPKVTSPPFVPKSQETFTHHVPKTPLTSPNLPYPQATTPHCFVQSQRTPPFFVARSQEAFAHFLPQTQENSSHLIPESQVTPPHHPNPQVTSPPFEPMSQETFAHLEPQPQVTSPNLPYPQAATPHRFAQTPVTSPPFVAESPVTSPYFVAKNQVTSHHLVPQTQVTSPHLLPQTQVATSNCFDLAQTSTPYLPYSTSPHLHQPHVTSSHLAPESQVTSPHFVPQITFPNFPDHHITSPHIFYLPQHHLANINLDLENPDWTRSEPPSELLRSYSHTTAHLDLQNQFSTGVTHHRDELEDTPKLPYNTHLARDVYGQADAPGPAQDTWRPALSPLGSLTGGVPQGRWSSVEFSSSSAEDFSSTQFYHDDSSPQPFCSPTTPGPSPHYPQTPTISSPQTQPSKDRLDFHTQTSRPLSRDKTLSCCLQDFDMYLMTSDPGRRHQTTRHLLQSQSGLVQDQTSLLHTVGNFVSCFSPQRADQDVSGSAQRPDLLTGLNQREERGGRGDDTQKVFKLLLKLYFTLLYFFSSRNLTS